MNKKLSISALVLMLIMMLSACQNAQVSSSSQSKSKSDNESPQGIVFKGVWDEDRTFLAEEIKAFEPYEALIKSSTSNGEIKETQVKGTLLKDILAENSADIEDFETVRIVSSDGYEIIVPTDVFKNREIILSYEENGKEYEGDLGAFRSVVPDERAMYWVKGVVLLDFSENVESSNIEKMVFLDNVGEYLELEDYTYYEATDKAIKISDLVEKCVKLGDETSGTLIASDGLKDDKDIKTLNDGYLKLTGEFAPLFTSPDMPKGMQIKGLSYLKIGNTSFASVSALGGEIDLKSILKDGSLDDSSYLAYDIDGNETVIEGKAINSSVLKIENESLYLVNEDESIKIKIKEILKK